MALRAIAGSRRDRDEVGITQRVGVLAARAVAVFALHIATFLSAAGMAAQLPLVKTVGNTQPVCAAISSNPPLAELVLASKPTEWQLMQFLVK